MPRQERRQPCETLHELFDRYRIELHEIPVPGRDHGGSRSKIYCPQCGGGREKERNFFVAIDRDGMGATWHCFRANNCGFSGGERLKGAPERPQRAPKQYRKPAPRPERFQPPPDRLVAYYERFGISAYTLSALGIFRTTFRMPVIDRDGKEVVDDRNGTRLQEERDVIAYPYVDDGELVNVKYRAMYVRGDRTVKRFKQEFNCRPTLFNIDSFESDEWGIFVEGEDDVAAIYEAGWRQVTTLVDGSPTKVSDEKDFDRNTDDDLRYVALYGEPRLDRLKKIYLAGDMDTAGARHTEEIARRVGKGRCYLVRWPQGCKDAKDTLQKHGPDAITHAITTALPFPLEGVYMPTDEEMANLKAGLLEKRIVTGISAIDQRFCLSEDGQLLITTGISGRGKTTFWNAMAMLYTERALEEMKVDRLARPFHTIIISPEMKPYRIMAALISMRSHLPYWDTAMQASVPLEQIFSEYKPWVERHFTLVHWPDRSTQPPASWVRDRIREITHRTGSKLCIVDPWQEIDDEMPDGFRGTSSKWIGSQLQRFVGLAAEVKTNIALVVHPTKLKRDKEGKIHIPDGNDIADSVHFWSRCDLGLTIHRPNDATDEMLLRVWKTKTRRFGQYGDTVLRFDPATERIYPRPAEVDSAGNHMPRYWQDNGS